MEQKIPKIFVIILNYNNLATLNDCLNKVFMSDYKNFEVVVVDNDSHDGSLEKAREHFSRAHFIKNSANVGFSQGNNVGIRYALEKFADFVLILNSDAFIETTTLTQLLLASTQNPSAGILSPLILDKNNAVWFAGGQIDWKKMCAQHIRTTSTKNMPYTTEYICGCAMFVKKEVFKEIGLFDERYFLYYEDTDFSYRAKKSNYDLLIVPQLKITHFEQSNSTKSAKTYWLVFSALIFFFTHSNFWQKLWLYPYLFLRKIKNYYDITVNHSTLAREVARAYNDYSKMKKL